MKDYGVAFDVAQPAHFDRAQVFLRILIIVLLSVLGGSSGWLNGIVYLGVPVVAAVLISQKGAARYLAESPGDITKWLRYIVSFYAYMTLMTDKFPTSDASAQAVRFEVSTSGTPSAGQALLRIILAIPSVIVLALLWIAGFVLLIIAAISVLINETYPAGIYGFLRGLNRWNARVYAYLADLVEDYPPFSLDTGPLDEAPSGQMEAQPQ